MIELRQLNSFVAVAEELHFARAAERLHIAQPAVSMQVKALEQQLAVRLLERSRRSVSLTAAGALFLDEARLTLRHARHAEEVGRQASRAERGRIAIGYSSSVPFTGALSTILRGFRAERPAVELSLTELTAPQIMERLENGTLDFGLFRSGYAERRSGVLTTPLLRERYDVVMSSSHRLAARDLVPVPELAEEPFIAYSSAMMSPMHDICRCAGFTPRIAQTVSQITTIVSLAAAGLGVAIVPHSLSQLHITDAAFRPLAIDDISMLAFACRRNEQAPATLALIQEAKRYAARMAADSKQTARCHGQSDTSVRFAIL
jgi:DNA-binding transcriptional LysR family regulator